MLSIGQERCKLQKYLSPEKGKVELPQVTGTYAMPFKILSFMSGLEAFSTFDKMPIKGCTKKTASSDTSRSFIRPGQPTTDANQQ